MAIDILVEQMDYQINSLQRGVKLCWQLKELAEELAGDLSAVGVVSMSFPGYITFHPGEGHSSREVAAQLVALLDVQLEKRLDPDGDLRFSGYHKIGDSSWFVTTYGKPDALCRIERIETGRREVIDYRYEIHCGDQGEANQ
jgi:hypothetical protein